MTVLKKLLLVATVSVLTLGVFVAGRTAALAVTTTTDPYNYDYSYSDGTSTHTYTSGDAQAAAGVGLAVFGMMLVPMLCIGLVFYIYFGVAMMTIAKKVGVANGWMAFVPILGTYLMNEIAGLDSWMFLLAFVPGVNVVYMIYVYMKIAERRGFENWVGLLMLVPVVDFFIPAYLAWGTPSGAAVSAPVAGPVVQK